MQRPRFRYLAPLPPLLRALRGLFPLDVPPSPQPQPEPEPEPEP